MSDPALGLLMLALIVVVIMMGFPTAFTLMGLGMFFGFIAFYDPTQLFTHNKVFDLNSLEKIFLIGLTSVIYGRVLPGVEASDFQLFLGIAVFVVINSAIGLWSARRGYGWDSATMTFGIVFATNVVLVLVADLLLAQGQRTLSLSDTLFFVFLVSILTTLYDRYRPVNAYRVTHTAKDDVSP